MLKDKLKRYAKIGLVLYALNKTLIPFAAYNHMGDDVGDTRIQIAMQTERYLHKYKDADKQDSALHYLKLAHAITNKFLKLGNPPADLELILKKRVGDCVQTSRFTYSNYLFLVNSLGEDNLKEYVRLAGGSICGYGHMWVEIKQAGKWVPYETTARDISDTTEINPNSIDRLIPTENVLGSLNSQRNYNGTDFFQFDEKGKERSGINFFNIMKEPGYLLLLWRAFMH